MRCANKKIFCAILFSLSIFSNSILAFAANEIWQGGVSANTSDANWSGGTTTSGDSWEFANNGAFTTLNNDLSGFTVAGITFDVSNPGYTLNGNSITLTGDIANDSNNNETLAMGITGGTITNSGTGTGNVIISGAIGSAVSGVTQNSATSTLVLSNTNSYTGTTTITQGTLQTAAAGAIPNSSDVTIAGGAFLDLDDNSQTIGSLAGAGTVTSSTAGSITLAAGIDNATTTFSGVIQDGSGTVGFEKDGSGTLTLSGVNTYTGTTNITGGTLMTAVAGAISSSSNVSVSNGAILDLDGNSQTIGSLAGAGIVTNSVGGSIVLTTGDTSVTNFSGTLQNGNGTLGLNVQGSGTFTLSGNNTYTGNTTLTSGTLDLGSSNAIGSGTINFNGGDLQFSSRNTTDYSSQFSTANNQQYNIDTNNQSVTFATALTSSGGSLTKLGSGTLILNANNTYTGGTTITAGTLQVGNSNALGTGAVTNNATLNLGTTNLTLGGAATYTQNAGSTLSLTVVSPSSFGMITTAVAASVAAGSSIHVSVANGYIANNTTFDIIDTQGAGITGGAPTTVTSTSPFISFVSSISSGGDLILTANNTTTGISSFGNNHNSQAAGLALGRITNPSADVVTVLTALESQSNSNITASLNTIGPVVDGGVVQNSSAAFNNLVSATLDRIQNAITQAQSGISPDTSQPNSVWAKPYGSYLKQNMTNQGLQQYDAWNAGTVVGYDHMVSENLTVGISGGYAYGNVGGEINGASTSMNSAQGAIYAGYQDPTLGYFVDATGSLALDWYQGQRSISVGSLNRTADSNYFGQQYGAYVEGGYKFSFTENPLYPNLQVTPLVSLQWTHLSLNSYTETNAGSLDLNVSSQDYDTVESGLGTSIADPIQFDWGNFIPEIHVKWLHDFNENQMVVTSSFVGGGGSFTSYGAKLARDGINVGGKLTFDVSSAISLIADADTEFRDGFMGVYGSGTVRYKF